MPTSNARRTRERAVPLGARGPDDDFFCHKYQVWYRVDDCVYRGKNRTFPGCVDCFQGHLNIRSLERGVRPPAFLGQAPARDPEPHAGSVLPFAGAPRAR